MHACVCVCVRALACGRGQGKKARRSIGPSQKARAAIDETVDGCIGNGYHRLSEYPKTNKQKLEREHSSDGTKVRLAPRKSIGTLG